MLKAHGMAFLRWHCQSCPDSMQCRCLKNVTSQQDLHRDFKSTGSRGTREHITFSWLLSHYSTCFSLLSLQELYISPSTKVGLTTENFSPPRLPPHSWLSLCFLPQALADKIGLGCSLVRGEYGRAWNEVKLMNESQKGVIGGLPPPEVYIVDLMFHPGALMKLKSKEADRYRFL